MLAPFASTAMSAVDAGMKQEKPTPPEPSAPSTEPRELSQWHQLQQLKQENEQDIQSNIPPGNARAEREKEDPDFLAQFELQQKLSASQQARQHFLTVRQRILPERYVPDSDNWKAHASLDAKLLSKTGTTTDDRIFRQAFYFILDALSQVAVRRYRACSDRTRRTMLLVHSLYRTLMDRTTTTRSSYDKTFDLANNPVNFANFPHPEFPVRVSAVLGPLFESHPVLPLQVASGLLALTLQAFDNYEEGAALISHDPSDIGHMSIYSIPYSIQSIFVLYAIMASLVQIKTKTMNTITGYTYPKNANNSAQTLMNANKRAQPTMNASSWVSTQHHEGLFYAVQFIFTLYALIVSLVRTKIKTRNAIMGYTYPKNASNSAQTLMNANKRARPTMNASSWVFTHHHEGFYCSNQFIFALSALIISLVQTKIKTMNAIMGYTYPKNAHNRAQTVMNANKRARPTMNACSWVFTQRHATVKKQRLKFLLIGCIWVLHSFSCVAAIPSDGDHNIPGSPLQEWGPQMLEPRAASKKRNQWMHSINGNISCSICHCDLYPKIFHKHNRHFSKPAIQLSNGMLVHHFHYCTEHLSLWYFRKGVKHYQVYYNYKAKNLYRHILAARAASGKPGDHDSAKLMLSPFFALHKFSNRVQLDYSGRESRSASGAEIVHQNLRSQDSRLRRYLAFLNNRRKSRRQYRLWLSSVLEAGKFTLARPSGPRKRVTNSPNQLCRAYKTFRKEVTLGSRAFLFKHYVKPSLLDLPNRLLSWRPPQNQLNVLTWNIETLIGLGKYEALAQTSLQYRADIVCLQETKSTSSNEITSLGGKYLLSGVPTEPSAGVGFYIPPHVLPLVSDFLPFSGRLAAITLRTQPLPTHIITVYAPSMLQDANADRIRKSHFWDSLPELIRILPSPAVIVLAGDFNARVTRDSLEQYTEYVGPAVFPHDNPFDPDSNYSHLLEFMIQHEYTIASTHFKRPPSRIVTYREISSDPNVRHTSPTPSDFAAIDHIVTPRRQLHNLLNATTRFEYKLPWFHRHFPVQFIITFDKFSLPKKKPSPKTHIPLTDEDKRKYRRAFPDPPESLRKGTLRQVPSPNSQSIYTDGSCPNQMDIRPGNPAGWAFTYKRDFQWIDAYGPVGQNLSITPIGSNNSSELQALIETLDYLLRFPSTFSNMPIDIYTDSLFVYNMAHDLNIPCAHTRLVQHLRSLLDLALHKFDLAILKIRGHAGHEGNERADRLAFLGVTAASNIGRHAHPPRLLLESQSAPSTLQGTIDAQSEHLLETVLHCSTSLTPNPQTVYHKEYLSSNTKHLIEQIQNTSASDYDRLSKLRKAVKRHVKKDKRQHICDQLLRDATGPPSKQWNTLKFIRKPYVPRTQAVVDSQGRPGSKNAKASILAQHLADNVWCAPASSLLPDTLLHAPADIPLTPFTESELDFALHRMRHRRAPGPDRAPAELWKFAPRHFRLLLLSHFNQVFAEASAPQTWSFAHVIMIFKGKKKDPRQPSSYRPISLVNTVYKIYAAMLHARLREHIDSRISPVQYGFRAGRSTSTPLFILRRLLELHERHGLSFYVLFLDWAQAFDTVSHYALRNSLHRIGVPPHFINAIMAIYCSASFAVRDSGNCSKIKPFLRGIRQGCPLSPYLFIIVLSVLFEDTYSSFQEQYGTRHSVFSYDSPLTDIEYADDTLLLSRTALSLNRFLHVLQFQATLRGLFLNADKCHLLAINHRARVTLLDIPVQYCTCQSCHPILGDENPPSLVHLPPEEFAQYLGAMIQPNSSATKDVQHRYTQALRCFKALEPFYRNGSISLARKLLVHAQITLAILLYGSESQVYSRDHISRLNLIHYKTLRQIFSIRSTFYHKVISPSEECCSNEFLMKLAYEHAPRLRTPSQYIQSSRIAYLGHLLRHDQLLEARITFNPAHGYRRISTRRPGAPRIHWAELAMAEAYNRHQFLQTHRVPPRVYEVDHPFYALLHRTDIANLHTANLDNTLIYRTLRPIADQRSQWRFLVFPR